MSAQLGPAAPSPASPESETLRRCRPFASSALLRGEAARPNLAGLRVTLDQDVDALQHGYAQPLHLERLDLPVACEVYAVEHATDHLMCLL